MNVLGIGRKASHAAIFAVAATIGLFSGPAAAQYENAIADDCFLFVNVADAKSLREQAGETRFAELCNDPAMQPFVNGLKTEFRKLFSEVENQSGVSVESLLKIPQGQITLSAGLKPGLPIPYAVFLADVTGKTEQAQELLQTLEDKLDEQGLAKRSVGELTVYSIEDAPIEVCYGVVNDILAIGTDSTSLQQTLARIEQPRGESLAQSGMFRQFRERVEGAGDVEAFLNLSRLVPMAALGGPQAQQIVQMLGLDRFEYIGSSTTVGRGDFDSKMHFVVSTDGETTIMNLFKMPSAPTAPQDWVPPTVSSYSTFRWDLDSFYDTLSRILDNFVPGAMQQADLMVSQFPTPENPFIRSIRGDVIGPLGNRLTTLGDVTESNGQPVGRTLFAWELDDADKLNILVGNLMVMAGPFLETKTVKGATVYTFDAGALVAAQMPDPNQPTPVGVVGLTIANSHLYLATHIELLDQVLNHTGAGLAESPEYRQVSSVFPAQTSGVSYTKSDAQGRTVWHLIKSGQLSTGLRAAAQEREGDEWGRILEGFASALDGSNLPEFEQIQKYFTAAGGYSVMNQDGFHSVIFSLK